MNRESASRSSIPTPAWTRATSLRWSWGALALILAVLYSGWGLPRLWGLLALVPAVVLLIDRQQTGRESPLGRWRALVLTTCVLCGIGTLLLPLRPSPLWLSQNAESENDRLREALGRIEERLSEALDRTEEALDRGAGQPLRERLREAWPAVRRLLGDETGALAVVRPEEAVVAWAGSGFFVPEQPLVTSLLRPEQPAERDRYFITGDSLAATAFRLRDHPEGTLVASILLARHAESLGPAAGAVPALERELPPGIGQRLQIVSGGSGGDGAIDFTVGPWSEGESERPLRSVLQGVLLALLLVTTLGLLSRDDSVTRGLLAAPLIYGTVVPFALGGLGRPFNIGMITPSWTGHQLTNQAFLAVGAAALAIWFAFLQLRHTAEGKRPTHRGFRLWLTPVGIVLLWGIGLALLQDLYRFAPTWFWARVSFLPGGRDLVGWLIAIAMSLVLTSGTGGAAIALYRRSNRWGLPFAGTAALAGAAGAFLLRAWSGTLWVGLLAAVMGSVVSSWLLLRLKQRRALAVLLSLGVIATVVHLPLKWDYGRLLAHRTIEETAETLKASGVGLTPVEVTELRDQLTAVSIQLPRQPVYDVPIGYDEDRAAYLLWRHLSLERIDGVSGIFLSDDPTSGGGRFSTSPDLFDEALLDSLTTLARGGDPRLLLTGGSPGYFGEETLFLAVGRTGGEGALVVGVRGRPLSFFTPGQEDIWRRRDPTGTADRSGRLVGALYLRVYDEAYRLLAVPHSADAAPEGPTVPPGVVDAIREHPEGVWIRKGDWAAGGADEYYFLLETPGEQPSVPGTAITSVESAVSQVAQLGIVRIALLGVVRPGIWGRIVETLNLLLLFTGALLALAWLPAAALSSSGIPIARRLRRVSFRTRLLIPLLVVALVPMIALWLFTRAFILNREATAWEEGLDRAVQDAQRSVLLSSERMAADLAREAYRGSMASLPEMPPGTHWALYDADLVERAGNLTDVLADRIPVRETVLGRGPQSFVVRTDDAWSIAIASIGSDYSSGAAVVVQPLNEQLLRQVTGPSGWQVDLFMDSQLRYSTDPAPYDAGLLPRFLPGDLEWEGSRGREIGGFRWGSLRGLRHLSAYRPLTDYSGFTVATIAQRRFGMWGLHDPALDRLFATVASIYLLLVGAVTLVALIVARRISEPIGMLTRSARRISGGDLEVDISVTRGDEVGGLQKAFRQMLIALRESRSRLAHAERERAWQEMARQVAHEIKNPLTPMQLSAQFLQRAFDEDAEDLERIVKECTGSIVEQVEELRRIANEFSAYARLPVVSRSPTRLNEPVEEALNLFIPALPDGVTVERDLADGLPLLELDSEQVRRVVINLIRNALDAMGEEGVLTVRTGEDLEGVWLQVSDTGEGIAPEVQERLFEPYFSTRTDGTGLGLAITRAVVDAHGGRLTVDSRSGEGTTMTAHFPFA